MSERFWSKVFKTPTPGCWLWTAARDQDGYGQFKYDGQMRGAHRYAYLLVGGHIPDGMQLDHICRVKHCVNPAHLRVVTQKQNGEHRGLNRNNTSGERGVYRDRERWRGMVKHHTVQHNSPRFATPEEAVEWVRAKRKELFTHSD